MKFTVIKLAYKLSTRMKYISLINSLADFIIVILHEVPRVTYIFNSINYARNDCTYINIYITVLVFY